MVTPDGKFILVTNVVSNPVRVIDAKDDSVFIKIPFDRMPADIAVTGNGNFASVTDQGAAIITVSDIKSFNDVNHIEVADNPFTFV